MANNISSLITAGTEIKDLSTSDSKMTIKKFLEWKDQVKLNTKSLPIYPSICSALMVQKDVFSQKPKIDSVKSSIDKVLTLLKDISVVGAMANELNEQTALTVVRLTFLSI